MEQQQNIVEQTNPQNQPELSPEPQALVGGVMPIMSRPKPTTVKEAGIEAIRYLKAQKII